MLAAFGMPSVTWNKGSVQKNALSEPNYTPLPDFPTRGSNSFIFY